MATTQRKKRLCSENKTLLELIYFLGKGIMFRQHILRYMKEFEGKHETDISKILQELEDNEILDSYNYFGSRVLKLKKFVVYFILEKEREDVASITFSAEKVKKSAFLNEIVLKETDFLKKHLKSLPEVINYYLKNTTFFSKDKESYLYFEQMEAKNFTTKYVAAEIDLLKKIEKNTHTFQKASERKEKNTFNLNAMAGRNIYMGLLRRNLDKKINLDKEIYLFIDILDLNGLANGKKFTYKIKKTLDYLNSLIDIEKIDFKFVLHVQSQARKEFMEKQRKFIDLELNKNYGKINWEINNLDLENNMFRGQKILLNA